jgi:hypothetical protein
MKMQGIKKFITGKSAEHIVIIRLHELHFKSKEQVEALKVYLNVNSWDWRAESDIIHEDDCACTIDGHINPQMKYHSKYNCHNDELGIMKAKI